MGRIQSTIGLVSGLPIQDTVDKLMALSARSRDVLIQRTERLSRQQVAVTGLTARVLGVQLAATNLSRANNFDTKQAVSQYPSLLGATITGDPPEGVYQLTPLRTAQTQQSLSSGFAGKYDPIGAGTFTFRSGGYVDEGISLDLLNEGHGVQRGKIRVTDRSGASQVIDLRYATNVDDVIGAINGADGINVTALADGDRFRLVDNTGQTGNVKVQEVSGGTTAEDLGLAGIDAALGEEALGDDLLRLYDGMGLDELNDGNGVALRDTLPDLDVTFRDGTTLLVDFRRLGQGKAAAQATTDAASGVDARLTFTAKEEGGDYDGITIRFVHDPNVVRGAETVVYNANNPNDKTLTISINAGQTDANNVVAAVKRNSVVDAMFTVTPDGTGLGKITTSDAAVTSGGLSHATALTNSLNGANAQVLFTAVASGGQFDDVAIAYVHDDTVSQGQETVAYDAQNKTLTVRVYSGQTTANDVINALNNDPEASNVFTAATAEDGDGSGQILIGDTTGLATSGGEIIEARNEKTVGELLATFNDADPTRLRAELAADGNRIVLYDLTVDDGDSATTFSVQSFALDGGHVAESLGLTGGAVDGVITGERLLSGLKSTLLRSLNGGAGLGTLGTVALKDRSGAAATVDLSNAETLEEAITAINAAGVGITAKVNEARNGIQLADTSGSTAENLIVGLTRAQAATTGDGDNAGLVFTAAMGGVDYNDVTIRFVDNPAISRGSETVVYDDVDPDNKTLTFGIDVGQTTANDVIAALARDSIAQQLFTAATVPGGDGEGVIDVAHTAVTAGGATSAAAGALGIAVDDAVGSVNGGPLYRQTASESTRLDDLNGGEGVFRSTIKIYNSLGVSGRVNLALPGIDTLGDVINAINGLDIDVVARINGTGDGLLLTDEAGGTQTFRAEELGQFGFAARDLNLLGAAKTVNGKQVIDGSTTFTVEVDTGDSLQDLVNAVNGLDAGVTATIFNDGSASNPFRLSLMSDRSGRAGSFLFDASQIGFDVDTIVQGQDAMLLFGSSGNAGAGVLAASSSNTFDDLLEGLSLTVGGTSSEPVQVSVATTDSTLISNLNVFVQQYNLLRDNLDDLTVYNESDQTIGVLFGTNEALRIDTELAGLMSGRFFGVGSMQSIEELGLSLTRDGRLTFSESKARAKFAEDPDAVNRFLADEQLGVVAKLTDLIDLFTDEENSLLTNRLKSLQLKIDSNNERIELMNVKLENERKRMLTDFYNMELAIGKLQNNLMALNALQPIEPMKIGSATGY